MRTMYTKILVPLDDSRASQRGLDEAIGLAARLDATLHLLNVVDARLLIGAVSAFSPPDQLIQAELFRAANLDDTV